MRQREFGHLLFFGLHFVDVNFLQKQFQLKLNDEYLRYMFSHNTNFVHLSMRRSNRFSPLTLTTIINKMHRLVTLNLAGTALLFCNCLF